MIHIDYDLDFLKFCFPRNDEMCQCLLHNITRHITETNWEKVSSFDRYTSSSIQIQHNWHQILQDKEQRFAH